MTVTGSRGVRQERKAKGLSHIGAGPFCYQLGMGKACFNKSGHKVEKSRDSQAFSKAFSH
jgi:hypothetical protein